MTTKSDGGGAAFPAALETYVEGGDGMSLRDYFAVHASDGDVQARMDVSPGLSRQRARYKHADSMLEARDEMED